MVGKENDLTASAGSFKSTSRCECGFLSARIEPMKIAAPRRSPFGAHVRQGTIFGSKGGLHELSAKQTIWKSRSRHSHFDRLLAWKAATSNSPRMNAIHTLSAIFGCNASRCNISCDSVACGLPSFACEAPSAAAQDAESI